MSRRNRRIPHPYEPGPVRLSGGSPTPHTRAQPITAPEYAWGTEPEPFTQPQRWAEPEPFTEPQRKAEPEPRRRTQVERPLALPEPLPKPAPALPQRPAVEPSQVLPEPLPVPLPTPAAAPSQAPADEPFQVDHTYRDHPPKKDAAFLTAWGQGLLSDTDYLEPDVQQVNGLTATTNGAYITAADVQKVGAHMATQALDDGSCVHPGTKRLSGLSKCPEDVVTSAMRALHMSGWAEVQHKPTKTSPTVHRLIIRIGF